MLGKNIKYPILFEQCLKLLFLLDSHKNQAEGVQRLMWRVAIGKNTLTAFLSPMKWEIWKKLLSWSKNTFTLVKHKHKTFTGFATFN